MPSRKKPDYSVGMIRKLLDGYAELELGNDPLTDRSTSAGGGTKKPTVSRRFNMPEVYKADMDRAIQSLTPRQKLIIVAVDIDGREPRGAAYWLGCSTHDVMDWEHGAVTRMRNYLNNGGKR